MNRPSAGLLGRCAPGPRMPKDRDERGTGRKRCAPGEESDAGRRMPERATESYGAIDDTEVDEPDERTGQQEQQLADEAAGSADHHAILGKPWTTNRPRSP